MSACYYTVPTTIANATAYATTAVPSAYSYYPSVAYIVPSTAASVVIATSAVYPAVGTMYYAYGYEAKGGLHVLAP